MVFRGHLRYLCGVMSGLLVGFALAGPAAAKNQICLWIHSGTGDWHNTGFWSSIYLPQRPSVSGSSTTDVQINNGGTALISGDSGDVGCANMYLGTGVDQTGKVLMTGGSYLGYDVYVGTAGLGSLRVENGTFESWAREIAFGLGPEAVGGGVITGSGSHLNGGKLIVADEGYGELQLLDGAHCEFTGDSYIGANAGGTGKMFVDASTFSPNNLSVGYSGYGELTIRNGGLTELASPFKSVWVGAAAGGEGLITVTGTGSQLKTNNSLLLGEVGTGRLTTADHGQATINGTLHVGANGTLDLDGGAVACDTLDADAGATFTGDGGVLKLRDFPALDTINAHVQLGWKSHGARTLGAGEVCNVKQLTLGGEAAYEMTVETGGELIAGTALGLASNGTLNLNGGTITTGSFDAGPGTFHWNSGSVHLTSGLDADNMTLLANQTLEVTGDFCTGRENLGTMSQESGSVVLVNGVLRLGEDIGSEGQYTVRDGAELHNHGQWFVVGRWGEGQFRHVGGTVNATGKLYLAEASTGSGQYLLSGGSLDVGDTLHVGLHGQGAFLHQGGACAIHSDVIIGENTDSSGLVDISHATMTVDGGVYVGGNESRAGGAGRVTLAADGTLQASHFLIWGDGVVDGSGVLLGSVESRGTVSPGNSPGLLTIDGDYVQSADGILDIELGGILRGDEYDALVIQGEATFGGRLAVMLIDGFDPQNGDVFDILDWDSTTGTEFGTIALPSLSNGLIWDASQLYTDGKITVTPEPAVVTVLLVGWIGLARRRRRGRTR